VDQTANAPDRIAAELAADLDAGFAALFAAHQDVLFSTALRICGRWADAEDLTGRFLVVALGAGGFGLGMAYSSMLGRLTAAVPPDEAADLSGLVNTSAQVAAVAGVAAFGTVYFALEARPSFAFGAVAAALAAPAWRSGPRTRPVEGSRLARSRRSPPAPGQPASSASRPARRPGPFPSPSSASPGRKSPSGRGGSPAVRGRQPDSASWRGGRAS
jgi:hypothetical protein